MREQVDLRSDTVTKPTPEMRQAIATADVGDDAICVDPTVRQLEELTAEVLGTEAAIFVPSGTMANQIAIRILCSPGDEFLCESFSHIYNYQQGGFAQLSGVTARTILGAEGILRRSDLEGTIRPENDHMVRTRLLCLENTHNRASGRIQPLEVIEEATAWAHENGLRCHLDGARLFNAAIATESPAQQWCKHFDTISVCFSKGLGAPVGSAMAGTREHVAAARRHRKLFGGTMRQAGVIAAGALYGLRHHIERLAEDHANAQVLATTIRETEGLDLIGSHIDTNIVIFSTKRIGILAADFAARSRDKGILLSVVGKYSVRAVTHLDVTNHQVQVAANGIREIARTAAHRCEVSHQSDDVG